MKNTFKKSLSTIGAVIFGCALLCQQASAISLDIVNVTGTSQATSGQLVFNGDGTFQFDDATTGANVGYDFIVNGVTGGDNSAFGLVGNISGLFTIGTINAGPPEWALVASSGGATLSIFDGSTTFSGSIDWIKLTRDGTSGGFNIAGLVNLTGITYTGTVQDLIDLKGDGDASATIAFSFNPAKTIAELKAEALNTSYSGDLTSVVPDGGLTLALLGFALVGVEFMRRRFVAA